MIELNKKQHLLQLQNDTIEKIIDEQNKANYLIQQNSQQQNPCDFDECDKEAFYIVKDICLGIPIKINLCEEHYQEWEDMKLEKD